MTSIVTIGLLHNNVLNLYIMKNQINLDITTPCNQNYNQFTPTPKGGFCNACTKEVIDFTKMTTEDISIYFNTKNTNNVCGRFKNSQLTTYPSQAKKSKLSFISAIGLACLALLSLTSAKAQDNVSRVKTSKIKINQNQANITVKGTVYDNDGLPLPSANVVLQGTTVGVTTDFDGQFTFPEKLKEGDILVFSYVGYESKKMVIQNPDSMSNVLLNVNLSNDSYIMMGKVAVKSVYSSKK